MAVVVNSDAICSVRNNPELNSGLVENGCYCVIGHPVRDGMLVKTNISPPRIAQSRRDYNKTHMYSHKISTFNT